MEIEYDTASLTINFDLPADRKIRDNLLLIGESAATLRQNRCKYESEIITETTAAILAKYAERAKG